MGASNEADGKNSLLGEFLVALARAPEPVQEAILLYGLKQMTPYANTLIQPYPMLAHMMTILRRQSGGAASGNDDAA